MQGVLKHNSQQNKLLRISNRQKKPTSTNAVGLEAGVQMLVASVTSAVQYSIIRSLQEDQEMTYEQMNFTIPSYCGLANSSIPTTSTSSSCDRAYSEHFAGSTRCRFLLINPFWHHYLEVIAKLIDTRLHKTNHKVKSYA